jgi:hypothetical protein
MKLSSISDYTAPMIPLAVPDGAVDALLPTGLTRQTQSVTPPGTHPVLVPLARNYNTRPSSFALFRLDYLEYSVVVPYVRRTNASATLTYIPILFLDEWFPILLGILLYGFPKRHAIIATAPPSYRARRSSSGPALVSADLTASGDPLPPATFPHFAAIAPMLGFPIVTHWLDLVYVCSTMDWELETRARIQPVTGTLRMTEAFFPGLPRETYEIRGIDEAPLGGFLLQTEWTLSLPHRCPS